MERSGLWRGVISGGVVFIKELFLEKSCFCRELFMERSGGLERLGHAFSYLAI